MSRRSIIVLGDLCVDTVFDISDIDASVEPGSIELSRWGPMSDYLGGTAYNFARYAAKTFLDPVILGSIGDDVAGGLVEQLLIGENIRHHVWRTSAHGTARTLLIYGDNGTRMMFAESPNANLSMPTRFVDDVWPNVSESFAVWLSGLCLRDRGSDRYAAVRHVLDRARADGMKVLIDLVPHEFHQYFSNVDTLIEEMGPIDVAVADVAAARRLLGVGTPGETVTDAALDETAKLLLVTFESVVLRQQNGLDCHQLYRDRNGRSERMRSRMPSVSAARGYGDKLICEVLELVLGP